MICAKADTALQLEQVLREREAIRAAVFHEGLSIIERDRAAAYFASEEEGAQVLLCSEIGSEGRNFQFASQLVMFDLPFNPDLLEQRIGRLGPYRPDARYPNHGALPGAHRAGGAGPLVPRGAGCLRTHLPDRPHHLRQLLRAVDRLSGRADRTGRLRRIHPRLPPAARSVESAAGTGRDRLLEMHSNGGDKAQALAAAIAEQDNDVNLVGFALNLFDIVGINQEDRSDNLIVLTPSDHMLVPDFPGLPQDGCTVTFDRDRALSREDAQFVSWEHPIIRNGLDLILSGDTGSCAVSLLKNKALPVGTLLVELVYVVEAQAPKHLQLTRFLPPTPIRMLMDRKGTNLAAQVEFESFNRQLNAVNRHTSSKLVNAVQQDVHAMLQQAESLGSAGAHAYRTGEARGGRQAERRAGASGSAEGGQPEHPRRRSRSAGVQPPSGAGQPQ